MHRPLPLITARLTLFFRLLFLCVCCFHPQALHTCKARYLIDDAAENVIDINDVDKSIRILLFGDYEWNKRISRARTDHEDDFKSYGQRKVEGVQSEMVDEDDLKERGIVRVKDWKQVLEHILEERQREIADV